jgi:regulator of protease activity HflC (stomatin/prohibitin superfamily)
LLAALAVRAQINENASDFFNGGAQFYISNNIPDALKRTETGLKIYPDDVKLKELEKLLKQQQQQQQQQNQQKNQQNKQPNQSQNQQSKPQNQQNQAKQQKQQEQPAKAHAMTPEEAKRLLDAQKENEQLLQFKPQNQPQNANSPVKDW